MSRARTGQIKTNRTAYDAGYAGSLMAGAAAAGQPYQGQLGVDPTFGDILPYLRSSFMNVDKSVQSILPYLQEMARTGSPTDVTPIIASARSNAAGSTAQQMASIGQNYGMGEGSSQGLENALARAAIAQSMGQLEAQTRYGASEAAKGRQLSAQTALPGFAGAPLEAGSLYATIADAFAQRGQENNLLDYQEWIRQQMGPLAWRQLMGQFLGQPQTYAFQEQSPWLAALGGLGGILQGASGFMPSGGGGSQRV